jgi:hypothetical protein
MSKGWAGQGQKGTFGSGQGTWGKVIPNLNRKSIEDGCSFVVKFSKDGASSRRLLRHGRRWRLPPRYLGAYWGIAKPGVTS